jgi:hypothetical protein
MSSLPMTWVSDEPDNYNNDEHCIVMLSNSTMADVKCDVSYPYVCYKKKTEDPALTACGTVDTGIAN